MRHSAPTQPWLRELNIKTNYLSLPLQLPVSSLCLCFNFRQKYFHLQLLSCYLETVATQSGKCVRHLIRLKRNPLSGKQLIWLIILHYLLTPHTHKILDFNTQPAWDYCAEGFVRLVMAEKYLMFDPPLAWCSYVQHDLVFNKG